MGMPMGLKMPAGVLVTQQMVLEAVQMRVWLTNMCWVKFMEARLSWERWVWM